MCICIMLTVNSIHIATEKSIVNIFIQLQLLIIVTNLTHNISSLTHLLLGLKDSSFR